MCCLKPSSWTAARPRQKDRQRPLFHLGRCAERTARPAPGGGSGSGISRTRQAALHLRGSAACLDQSAHRAGAHLLQPDRFGHGAAGFLGPQSAKYSDPHRAGAARAQRLYGRGRAMCCSRSIIRRWNCALWRPCRAMKPCWRLPRRAGYSRRHCRGHLFHAAGTGDQGSCAGTPRRLTSA